VTTAAHINRIGTACPPNDVHRDFIVWAQGQLAAEPRKQKLFARMADRAGIGHRWSPLTPEGGGRYAAGGETFYGGPVFPSTAARMTVYAREAPRLALAAIAGLGAVDGVTHLVVASCTGFVAPGVDQLIASALGLSGAVQRTLIGFMGCYAAVVALRTADQIVRADPHARVLVVAVELTTLHMQDDHEVEPLLATLQFGDGAGAALVTAEPAGLRLGRFFAETLPDSAPLITWNIGDSGFAMHLSGEVPGRIASALLVPETRAALLGEDAAETIDGWAVHPGGRSILDAVESAFALPADMLAPSRAILQERGNMSSATLMFVLARTMAERRVERGVAVAFGPGMAAEGFRFASA
jgi:alpha-pyrone synthase